MDERPLVAVTMGDAAGIGPEVIVKALAEPGIHEICRPVVIGTGGILQQQIDNLGSQLQLRTVAEPEDARGTAGTIDLVDMLNLEPGEVRAGEVCAACGRAAMEYIKAAADLAVAGKVSAMATAPINKEAVMQAGYPDTGHMKYLVRLTGTTDYAAMLITGRLRVAHLTDHYSLQDAVGMVKQDIILSKLALIDRSFRNWGIPEPRIGVAALNPHGGDGGMFGREEIEEIAPAVEQARRRGIAAGGPVPADSVFNKAIRGEYDAVLAMYHDQGHIAIKVHDFERSLSVSLGLPFVRTSVDHGTAFDIAGKGIADSRSMVEAVRLAVNLANGKLG